MTGFPRRFESQQDYAIAQRLKPEIEDVRDFFLGLLQPPTKQQIAVNIEMIEGRGFEKTLPLDPQALAEEIEMQKAIKREWLEDLKEFPADLVELACKRWRRANNNRPPYASGELMESVKPEFIRRKSLYMKAKSVLEIIK